MTDEFKPGDIVFLKSGSPPLTVDGSGQGMIEVAWFDDCGELGRGRFPAACLTYNSPLLEQLMGDVDLRDIPHGGSA